MLQEYKGYWIDGEARMVHPYPPDTYPEAHILRNGRSGSIVEVGRFALRKFTMETETWPRTSALNWQRWLSITA